MTDQQPDPTWDRDPADPIDTPQPGPVDNPEPDPQSWPDTTPQEAPGEDSPPMKARGAGAVGGGAREPTSGESGEMAGGRLSGEVSEGQAQAPPVAAGLPPDIVGGYTGGLAASNQGAAGMRQIVAEDAAEERLRSIDHESPANMAQADE